MGVGALINDPLVEGRLKAHICIIGAGAAGITLAAELSRSGKKIVILESGLSEADPKISSLYEGEPGALMRRIGHQDFLTESRTRCEGGSTNCWGGTCRPLDTIDFEKRKGVHYSGWPITPNELEPFYRRAHDFCGLDDYVYDDAAYWIPKIGDQSLRLMPHSPRMKSVVFQEMSHEPNPVDNRRFQHALARTVASFPNVTFYGDATVTFLESSKDGKIIVCAHVSTCQGIRFKVVADTFVLAAGGIETVRILMLSDQNQATNGGIGNHSGLLGKFFMVHPLIQRVADTELDGVTWSLYTEPKIIRESNTILTVRLAPTETEIRGSGLGNFRFYLPYHQDAGKVIVNLNWEQAPNPNSFVRLMDDVDFLGQKRVELHWELTQKDKETARWALSLLQQEFHELGLGKLKTLSDLRGDADEWEPYGGPFSSGLDPGDHHMGTTRMSIDPDDGVVDTNCKIHHTNNLYIAGSSVFPTGGYANPTLSIIALAMRLASYLRLV